MLKQNFSEGDIVEIHTNCTDDKLMKWADKPLLVIDVYKDNRDNPDNFNEQAQANEAGYRLLNMLSHNELPVTIYNKDLEFVYPETYQKFYHTPQQELLPQKTIESSNSFFERTVDKVKSSKLLSHFFPQDESSPPTISDQPAHTEQNINKTPQISDEDKRTSVDFALSQLKKNSLTSPRL